jgi:hypothetical protein
MDLFKPNIPNLGKLWRVKVAMDMLVYFMSIWFNFQAIWHILWPIWYSFPPFWFIFTRFGILCQEKSGNPALLVTLLSGGQTANLGCR